MSYEGRHFCSFFLLKKPFQQHFSNIMAQGMHKSSAYAGHHIKLLTDMQMDRETNRLKK